MAKKKETKGHVLKLSFSNRVFNIVGLYPKETNIMNGLILKDIKTKVNLSASEKKNLDLKSFKNGSFSWEKKNDTIKQISFSNSEIKFLQDQINLLDNQSKITPESLDIALKIQSINLSGN